jgi:hypothetical protein
MYVDVIGSGVLVHMYVVRDVSRRMEPCFWIWFFLVRCFVFLVSINFNFSS